MAIELSRTLRNQLRAAFTADCLARDDLEPERRRDIENGLFARSGRLYSVWTNKRVRGTRPDGRPVMVPLWDDELFGFQQFALYMGPRPGMAKCCLIDEAEQHGPGNSQWDVGTGQAGERPTKVTGLPEYGPEHEQWVIETRRLLIDSLIVKARKEKGTEIAPERFLREQVHSDGSRDYLFQTWYDKVRYCGYSGINQISDDAKYQNYEGRRLEFFSGWLGSFGFELFAYHILTELGERPDGYSLDRKDNDRGYVPGNLRWATAQQQIDNQRPNLPPKGTPERLAEEQARAMGDLNRMAERQYREAIAAGVLKPDGDLPDTPEPEGPPVKSWEDM